MVKDLDKMSTFELGRWLSLMEAVNIIADECDERKIDFEKLRLEPLTVRKYIEGTCDIFCRKLEEQDHKESLYIPNFKARELV